MHLRPLLLFAAAFWLTALPALAWPSCAWGHRTEVTLDTAASGYTGEVRIDLTSADFAANYTFTPDGDDVRVYADDNVTLIDHLVTAWDPVLRTATIYISPGPLAGSSSTDFIIYYGNGSVASVGDATAVFPDVGIRLHSRVSTADPVSAADGLNAFVSATADVDNSVRTSISGLNNRAIGGTANNYGWCVSAVLEVTPATAGVWQFRYGGDFGRGGHLYVAETALEEQWNDDLWWANNYANTAETLEGSISLAAGWHRYEALGFEGCCDGSTGYQLRAPGGAWQDMSSANFPLRAARCIVPEITVTPAAPESCSSTLDATKIANVVSDLYGSDYALPGSVVQYDLAITNPGQTVDDGTIVLTDILPAGAALMFDGPAAFQLVDGPVSSGLTLAYSGPTSAGDDVEFSTDGINFSYTPTPSGTNQTDPAITHLRFRPQGDMNPSTSAGGDPSFTVRFFVEVE